MNKKCIEALSTEHALSKYFSQPFYIQIFLFKFSILMFFNGSKIRFLDDRNITQYFISNDALQLQVMLSVADLHTSETEALYSPYHLFTKNKILNIG